MKKILRILFGVSILFLIIGAVSANENITDNPLQTMPEEPSLGANEEVTFINTEVDIDDINAPIIRINTTNTTNEVIIESFGRDEDIQK